MSNIKLDLADFKHVKSDDKTTTLESKHGHTITLAHNVLSKANQEQLKALAGNQEHKSSVYGKTYTPDMDNKKMGARPPVKKFAEGGEEDYKGHYADNSQPEGPQAPMDSQDMGGQGVLAPSQEQPQDMGGAGVMKPDSQSDAPQAPDKQIADDVTPKLGDQAPAGDQPEAKLKDIDPDSPAPAPKAPVEVKAAKPVPTPAEKFESLKSEQFHDLRSENQAFWNDLMNGHIQPKTYGDIMWHNKDGSEKSILGKIGTVFGLLLGGAGSGLAHQQNHFIGMMDNIIQRDIDAQKTNKTNAMSLYKMNMDSEMNRAQFGLIQKQGFLTDAQAKATRQEAALKAQLLTYNQSWGIALHNMSEKLNKMPDGPPGSPQAIAKQQAAAQFGMIYNAAKDKMVHAEDLAASGAALLQMGQTGQGQEQDFARQQQALKIGGMGDLASDNETHHIEGIPGRANRPIDGHIRDEIQAHNVLDQKAQDLLAYIKTNKGTLDPKKRAIAEQKVEEMKNFYNDSIKGGALTQGRLAWYEEQFGKRNPTSILNSILGDTEKFKEIANSNRGRRDILIKSIGLTPPKDYNQMQSPGSQGSDSEPETIERKDPKTGKIWVFDAKTKKPLHSK